MSRSEVKNSLLQLERLAGEEEKTAVASVLNVASEMLHKQKGRQGIVLLIIDLLRNNLDT